MTTTNDGDGLRRVTGWLLVIGAVTFAVAATILSSTFEWPDILREPPEVVLPAFVAGALTDDPDTIDLYFGYARQGRSALWVHVPDEADAKRVVRALADHQVLHIRHYGHGRQDDLHIR